MPSARMAYLRSYDSKHGLEKYDRDIDRFILSVIRRDKMHKLLRAASLHELKDYTCDHLIQRDPRRERYDAEVQIPTKYLFDKIYDLMLRGRNGPRIADFCSLLLDRESYAKVCAGWVLDRILHDLLVLRRQSPIEPLVPSTGSTVTGEHRKTDQNSTTVKHLAMKLKKGEAAELGNTAFDTDSLERIPLKWYDTNSVLALKNAYYAPSQPDHPTFDSFLFNAPRGLAVVFKVIVSGNHVVKPEGLRWLWRQKKVKKVWYVAVTLDRDVDLALEDGVASLVEEWYQLRVKEDDLSRVPGLFERNTDTR